MIGLHIEQRSFDETGQTAATGMRHLHHQQQGANIVRVAAKTALPIVSSVPKCRRPKALRTHPVDTVNGAPILSTGASGPMRPMALDSQQVSQCNGRKQTMAPLEPDQVLLIVNDDHIKGGGVPIIGRRVPSKSALAVRSGAPANPTNYQHHLHPSTDCLIMNNGAAERTTQQQSAPVIGRRSYRMIQQKQQQVGTIYQYDCHDYIQPSSSGGTRANRLATQYKHQQPLDGRPYELERAGDPLVETPASAEPNRHRRPSKYQGSVSAMNLAEPVLVNEYILPPMEKSAAKRAGGGKRASGSARQLLISAGQQQRYHHDASDCSPMCSLAASANNLRPGSSSGYLDASNEYAACCSSPTCASMGNLDTLLDPPSCCRAPYEQLCAPVRAVSCQRTPAACCAGPPVKSASNCLHNQHHQHSRPQAQSAALDAAQSARSHREAARSSHFHDHHSSCQANRAGGAPQQQQVAARPTGSAYRSKSCHDPHRALRGRNPLPPVHPKPVLNYMCPASDYLALASPATGSGKLTRNSLTGGSFQSSNSADDPAAVTQMYESLAAELKAKLGDPKMGPILLPPKDYDTMSRKQGKLTGIELRRSTNPQLVGPAANRLAGVESRTQSGRTTGSISEERQVTTTGQEETTVTIGATNRQQQQPVKSCESSRSSGRSSGHDETASRSSRSNSSSGLGSISIEEAESKLTSSSEDMRQAHMRLATANNNNYTRVNINNQPTDKQFNETQVNLRGSTSSQVDRKNPSPDNSDSGHSGSARLDSGLSSDEQKLMLRETNDHFYNNSPPSTPSPSMGSNHTNSIGDSKETGRSPMSPSSQSGRELGRGVGMHNHNPSKVSSGVLWNGRVEVPLKVNSAKNGNTYLATKQIIY